VELVGWTVGIVLFGVAALFPQQLISFLGMGRGRPKLGGSFTFLRGETAGLPRVG